MRNAIRFVAIGALALIPAAAGAQMYGEPVIVEEAPVIIEEGPAIIEEPGYEVVEPEVFVESGPIDAEDAREIALINGLVEVDDVDSRFDGDFEVRGDDASGDGMEIIIDRDTGDVLSIDN